jgi:ribonuclease BN (tRNA processing enzyme)
MDLGPGTLARLQLAGDIGAAQALVISHYHPDHFSDILTLRYALRKAKNQGALHGPMTLLLPVDGLDDFVATYIGDGYVDLFDVVPVEDGKTVELQDLSLHFEAMSHAVQSYGVSLQPKTRGAKAGGSQRWLLGYTSDTGPCDALVRLARRSRVLLSECAVAATDQTGIAAGHVWPEHIGQVAREAQVERLILTHFAPDADVASVATAASEAFGKRAWASAIGCTYHLQAPCTHGAGGRQS